MNKHIIRTLISASMVGVLALTFGVSGRALADDTPPPISTSTIDLDQPGSLTITKYSQPTDSEVGTQGTGAKGDTIPSSSQVIEGVTFTICMANIADRLDTTAGWDEATTLITSFRPASAKCGGGTWSPPLPSATTDEMGTASFENLSVGVYLVTETGTAAGVTPSTPFIVTIPMANPTDSTWMYDVFVYPKNAETAATKTVSDSEAHVLGDTVTFTIEADVPAVNPETAFKVSDPINPSLLAVQNVAITLSGCGGTSLSQYRDFNKTNAVMVTFSPFGLAKLGGCDLGSKVVVTITATVVAAGEISNTAYVCPNSMCDISPNAQYPGSRITTESVSTKWSTLTITKTDLESNKLAGAKFDVYLAGTDSSTLCDPTGKLIATTSETDNSGTTSVVLRYSDWYDGGSKQDQQYCVVEVQAPAGYVLDKSPNPVDVSGLSTSLEIQNAEYIIPSMILPMTGGFVSVTAFASYIIGAALLGGLVLLVVRRKRQQEDVQS